MRSRQPDCSQEDKELGQYRAESVGLHCHGPQSDVLLSRPYLQLSEATSPFILRRTSEVIQGFLPPKCKRFCCRGLLLLTALLALHLAEYVVFIAPTPIQRELYEHVIGSDAVQGYLGGSGKAALAMIDLLKKICNSPALLMRPDEKVCFFACSGGQTLLKSSP